MNWLTKLAKRKVTLQEAKAIGEEIGIDWPTSSFSIETFRKGMEVEMEHGSHDPETNVTDNCPMLTGKIAWAHLKERTDYYELLEKYVEK